MAKNKNMEAIARAAAKRAIKDMPKMDAAVARADGFVKMIHERDPEPALFTYALFNFLAEDLMKSGWEIELLKTSLDYTEKDFKNRVSQ